MRTLSHLAIGLLGLVVALGSVGCESKPSRGEYTLTISLHEDFKPQRDIEVDLVGVAAGRDLETMKAESVSSYFRAGNNFRATQPYRTALVFRKDGERSKTVDLSRRGLYAEWNDPSVMYLVAMARLDDPSGPDLRQYVLPLDKRRWKTKKLSLVIDSSRVSPLPAPEALEQ